jgi:hypothetical protein
MQKSLEKLNFKHSKMNLGFVYYFEHLDINGKRKSIERIENIVPTVGIAHIMALAIEAGTWYASLWTDNSYTPAASDTLSDVVTTGVEDTVYTIIGTARPTIVAPTSVVGLWTNAAQPIDFVFPSAIDIYGGFITNTVARGATTGTLLSEVAFDAAKVMGIGETLRATCGLQLTALAD